MHVTSGLVNLRLRGVLIRGLTKQALCARSHADIPLLSAHHTLVCTSHPRLRLMHRGPRTHRMCCGRIQDLDSARRCHASISITSTSRFSRLQPWFSQFICGRRSASAISPSDITPVHGGDRLGGASAFSPRRLPRPTLQLNDHRSVPVAHNVWQAPRMLCIATPPHWWKISVNVPEPSRPSIKTEGYLGDTQIRV
jgi:hypothetical protein